MAKYNLDKLLLGGLIYANRRYACVFNPVMGYPSSVAIHNGRLYYMGHRSPEYADYFWASQVNNFAEFGNHFRLFTVDNPQTREIREQQDQYDLYAATRLDSYGITAQTGVGSQIQGTITGGRNLLFHTSDVLYEFLEREVDTRGSISFQRVNRVDEVSIERGKHTVIDQAIYVADSNQNALVREKNNYLSLPTSSNYEPERVSTLKAFEHIRNPRAIASAQIDKFSADLVFVVNGDDEGAMNVYHTATEGGETVFSAWARWFAPGGYRFFDVYTRNGRIFVIIQNKIDDSSRLCEMSFEDGDFTDNLTDLDAMTITSRIVIPELLWENADGLFGRFAKGIDEIHGDVIRSSPFTVFYQPNLPDKGCRSFVVSQLEEKTVQGQAEFAQLRTDEHYLAGAFFVDNLTKKQYPRQRPFFADAVELVHDGDGPFELSLIEVVGFVEPAELDSKGGRRGR